LVPVADHSLGLTVSAPSPQDAQPSDGQPPSRTWVDERRVGRHAVLNAEGELDRTTVAELEAAIDAADHPGLTEIWIDMTETSFMDSSGVRLLLDTRARLAASFRQLVVICPPGPVLRLLAATAAPLDLEIRGARIAIPPPR
jgi:anti-anti-sigma factor